MKTQLEAFFAGLRSEADLDNLVKEQREEDLHLEFKQKEDSRDGNLGEGDKEAFSKAVSGFANADGGVLVFGIKTKKSQDSPDRASALKPITGADRLLTRLRDSILNTTQPPVDGVRVELVPGNPGEGFVKCLIPASDLVPHRAMLAEREYWRRVSVGGFRKMEHYELEDVFGRRLRPVLRLRIELRAQPDPDPHEEVHFLFLNEGRGVARHAGFLCTLKECKIVVVDGLSDVTRLNASQPSVSYYDSQNVVHPNGIYRALGRAIIQRPNKGTALSIEVKWYSENMNLRSEASEIEPNVPKMLAG